ncbi:cyclic lactone autoinducer peptide [Lachnospiraceae bacterium 54-53]
MKKLLSALKGKLTAVSVMNWCALVVAAYTINVACAGLHHQPEVPEEAKRLRKF